MIDYLNEMMLMSKKTNKYFMIVRKHEDEYLSVVYAEVPKHLPVLPREIRAAERLLIGRSGS